VAEGRSLVFTSGLAATSDVELAQAEKTLLAGNRVHDGFDRFTDDRERMARVKHPEEILIGRTLESQAASLGQWIIESFRRIEGSPLAPSPPSNRTD
jgi:hypothetical protein